MAFWEALGSIGGTLLGGIFGNKSKDKANKQQLELAREQMDREDQNIARNINLQREFAQHGVSWRVADAKAAGLSPLAALGATTMSFSPQSVGDTRPALDSTDYLAQGMAGLGQDLGRAIDSTRSTDAKASAYQKTVMDLSLQRMGLENELIASQIAKVRQPSVQASMPAVDQRWLVDGQGETQLPASPVIPVTAGPLIETGPLKRTASDPGSPNMEPGAINDIGFTRTATGWMPVQSNDTKQRLEEDFLGEWSWNIRNRIAPTVGWNYQVPFQAPSGKAWAYNPFMQEYQLIDGPLH